MRIGVLASGNGTNLQALIDAQELGQLAPAELACVICNRPGARAIDRAREAGLAAKLVDHKAYDSRDDFEDALLAVLEENRVDAVALAGVMRILTPRFVARFDNRIINTHPALCPAFPGIRAPKQALDYGVRVTGCTVHFVDGGVDTGPIIFQETVEVLTDDTPESLHKRIQAHEHRLLPTAVKLLASGSLRVFGRRVTIDDV
jgi:phosphoribosylglycinamide formyltransferase-1